MLHSDLLLRNVDFVLITETWFTDKQDDALVSIPGYNLFRRDRQGKVGGGIGIYVRANIIDCKLVEPSPSHNDLEIMWLQCRAHNILYYVACCYHPPKPRYHPSVLVDKLAADFQCIASMHDCYVMIVAGDFNLLDTSFIEIDFGLTQLVSDPTHGHNILDRVFVNRPDIYETLVFRSLIKTKHLAILVQPSDDGCHSKPKPSKRIKRRVYDLRQFNIDKLRFCLGSYDWGSVASFDDVIVMYRIFVQVVLSFVEVCIPTKTITLGPRDPDFVTPLVKSLLRRRNKLRKQGKISKADDLAVRINVLICEYRNKRLSHLADASPKELWAAVRAQRTKNLHDIEHLCDVNALNNFFADIATDPSYCVSDVTKFCAPLTQNSPDIAVFHDYQIEPLLRKLHTSSGLDDLPCWVLQKCSYELAGIIATIFNKSFLSGTVPIEWSKALITPVPKKPRPSAFSDYRPISVTPILSRLAEKIVVQQWLRPALPNNMLYDQFAFRPTGSTTCALVDFMHQATRMLEDNSYVRCLMIDFSKAFDVVKHSLLLSKVCALNIPPSILNWIIAFLTGRSQVCKLSDGTLSSLRSISRSIIQGSGLGPTLWLIMASDLHPLSFCNYIFKYADDTNLLVPEKTDVELSDEFSHIKLWADRNGLIINVDKTKELVLRRPHPINFHLPQALDGIEQVQTAKLLGVIFHECFKFDNHVETILSICSQRIFLLKQLRDQGLPRSHLHTVFQAIVLNRLTYALPAWGPFLSGELGHKINAFLKRSYRYGFTCAVFDIQFCLQSVMHDLFIKMQSSNHCLCHLLPSRRSHCRSLRTRGHDYELPRCVYKLHKQSFVINCLFRFLS